jgi:hypothetical protein
VESPPVQSPGLLKSGDSEDLSSSWWWSVSESAWRLVSVWNTATDVVEAPQLTLLRTFLVCAAVGIFPIRGACPANESGKYWGA